eukprot:363876-Chlamydomonas_euryale.AAC.3
MAGASAARRRRRRVASHRAQRAVREHMLYLAEHAAPQTRHQLRAPPRAGGGGRAVGGRLGEGIWGLRGGGNAPQGRRRQGRLLDGGRVLLRAQKGKM